MMEQAPIYRADSELTQEELELRNKSMAEAATAAQSNANLVFNPTTGAMESANTVHDELERLQGEQL